jgi:prepilin-type N-terminal cleavage/methylation domain-containing protein
MTGDKRVFKRKAGKVLRGERGFTLVELLMVCAIMVFVVGAVSLMLEGGYKTYAKVDDQIIAQNEARSNIQRMTKYIRQSKQITTAEQNEVVFSSDIDDDNIPETVRFYLSDSNNKLNQTTDDAETYELGRYIRNVTLGQPIFTYYDASGNQITDPYYARTASRSIKIELVIDTNSSEPPAAYELESTVELRNF